MIYTGNYYNCKEGNLISISGDRGKKTGFIGECYPKLAPKYDFWKVWESNIGKLSEKLNNDFYIREYYEKVLKNLDPYKVLKDLDNYILLCYEPNYKFCHRHIVAAWLEIECGIIVPEVMPVKGALIELDRPFEIKNQVNKLILLKR